MRLPANNHHCLQKLYNRLLLPLSQGFLQPQPLFFFPALIGFYCLLQRILYIFSVNYLLNYYQQDFSKHAKTSLVPRLNLVWNSIPMQLAKENKKFFFGQIKKGARSSEFEIAIQWLLDCGLV